MNDLSANPRLGRPKDAAKRGAITATARALFLSQPFEAVTMEAVAAKAGVSKMTVYSHFNDKETLFESVVMSISDQMVGVAIKTDCDRVGLRERLYAAGHSLLTIVLQPGLSNLSRSVVTATHGNLALSLRLYNAGPGRVRAHLVEIIADAVGRGELATHDCEAAADDLMSLWDRGKCFKIMSGLEENATPDEIEWQAARGVDVFLRIYQSPDMRGTGFVLAETAS